jgi:hypothetical protein
LHTTVQNNILFATATMIDLICIGIRLVAKYVYSNPARR